MNEWKKVLLGEISEIQGGLQVTSKRNSRPVEVPYVRVANVYRNYLDLDEIKKIRLTERELGRTSLEKGDLLVVEGHGNPNEIGRVAMWDGSISPCVHQNHLIRVRLNSRAIPAFIAAALNSPEGRLHLLRSASTTSGLNTISTSDVRTTPVMLPPLEEQRWIVEVLGRSDRLRAKRRQAVALLDDLAQSIFLDMFGASFERMRRQWPMRTLGNLSTVFSDGPFGSNLKSSHYRESGIRVIRLQNIGVGRFVDDDAAFISEEHFARLGKHTCLPGDVIIGTLGDPNLRAFVQPPEVAVALNKADCVQMRVDPAKATPVYISALLNQPIIERMAKSLMHGQTRTRISMGQLREMEVPVPPLQLQNEFGVRSELLTNQRSRHNDSLAELDSLFSSLQAKVFRGSCERLTTLVPVA